MAGSVGPGPAGTNPWAPSPRTGGPLGTNNDSGDPKVQKWVKGDTPGPLGLSDHADPAHNKSAGTVLPGRLGVAASMVAKLVMSGTPQSEEAANAKVMISYDIEVIAGSKFGRTDDGQQIVKLLRDLLAHDNIVYGETHGDPPPRGEWDGKTITVNKDYYGNSCKTIVELVHEASHAIWRRRHTIAKGKMESAEEGADNEYYAEKNELAIYKWLRKEKNCLPDADLDRRLEYEKDGKLKSHVQEAEKQSRQ